MVGLIGFNQIPCLSEEYIESLGYQTDKSIFLPSLEMKIHLGMKFYRDDGKVENREALLERAVQSLGEIGRPRIDALYIIGEGMQNPKYTHGGYVLAPQIMCRGRVNLISKAIINDADELGNVYTEAHEETHVVQRVDQTYLLIDWFKARGFKRINVMELTSKGNMEYLSSAVGLAALHLKGFPVKNINQAPYFEFDSNKEIHQELIPLLE